MNKCGGLNLESIECGCVRKVVVIRGYDLPFVGCYVCGGEVHLHLMVYGYSPIMVLGKVCLRSCDGETVQNSGVAYTRWWVVTSS